MRGHKTRMGNIKIDRGYYKIKLDGKNWMFFHRAMALSYGMEINGMDIHHIDGNRMNNTVENLCSITRAEHKRIHSTGHKTSKETREKIKNSMIGRFVSNETRIKMSKSQTGINNAMYGRKLTEEHKKSISEKMKGNTFCLGHKASDEARKNMSIARRGKPKSEEHNRKNSEAHKGKKHSDETKIKMSISIKEALRKKREGVAVW